MPAFCLPACTAEAAARKIAAAARRDRRYGERKIRGSEKTVSRLVEPSLNAMGYDLVRVQLTGGTGPTLQIMAERRDRAEMTVEDCARISRDVSAILDVEDPLPGSYTLEVSSPGIDRPLVRISDFERFAGFEARVETRDAIDGRRRFRGRLAGVEEASVLIDVDGNRHAVPHDGISRAKLVLTDDLIAASGVTAAADGPRPGGHLGD